ncbi:MAG: hypothetical protein KF729_00415 [Sandaracinaceae bacterium]|nr:hypothetical protein [Sandaracinaceae bacterium]
MSGAGPSPREIGARRALLLGAAAGALSAILGGLARFGWSVPALRTGTAAHGPLLVVGVFATVIGLERAVALGARWAYAGPAFGVAAIGAHALGAHAAAAWLASGSAAGLVAVDVAIVRRQPAAFTALMLLGALVLFGATLASALGRPVPEVALAWVAFFVCTIVAERLELSRLVRTPRAATLALSALLVVTAIAAGLAAQWPIATRALGGALVLVALWELRFDVASRTIRRAGLPRFVAVGVLSGVGWLAVAGALLAAKGFERTAAYDATLHAVFVGFVLSMVFAHAPIILPAVARVELPFHPILYAPLAALHASLALRVVAGLAGAAELRALGGLGNALALGLLVLAVLFARAAPRAA